MHRLHPPDITAMGETENKHHQMDKASSCYDRNKKEGWGWSTNLGGEGGRSQEGIIEPRPKVSEELARGNAGWGQREQHK